jgi:hypothetical protein
MPKSPPTKKKDALRFFERDTLIKGQPAKVECVEINGQSFAITRGALTIVSLEDEWYDDVRDPERVIQLLEESQEFKPDIFTFWQRMPDIKPKYPYRIEWEDIAVLPIKSYDHWFNHQIKSRIRSQIRKAEKDGLVLRETSYDDNFVKGMTTIFNEAPVRQGRRFWHYGKDFKTVKEQFSRFIHREDMIGAYYQDELIGFIMLVNAKEYAITGQIISAIKHRDKSTNNALIAKAVEVCEKRGLQYLIYLFWTDDSLAEFKRRCGFERVSVPRYFVPLSKKGNLALKVGLHRGWKELLPKRLKTSLKKLRSRWYGLSVD